jgi:hypothetical protein
MFQFRHTFYSTNALGRRDAPGAEKIMKTKKRNCRIGLQPSVLQKEVFDREIALCQSLSRDNNGRCHWGVCESCGVIPLLYKLHKGIVLEDLQNVQATRKQELAL